MSGRKLAAAAISWLFFPGSAAGTAMAGSRLKLMCKIVLENSGLCVCFSPVFAEQQMKLLCQLLVDL